jgi:tetratricopeptide (TPR) repeat protein
MQSSPRIEELRQKFHENPRRYFAPLANEYRKAGDPEQAIAICRAHLAQQPGHMSGHVVYGQALYDAHRTDEAREVFQLALALDPENIIVLRHLGDIARQRGEIEEARSWYSRALDGDPHDAEVAAYLAELTESLLSGGGESESAAPATPDTGKEPAALAEHIEKEPGSPYAEPASVADVPEASALSNESPYLDLEPEEKTSATAGEADADAVRSPAGRESRPTPTSESFPIVTRTLAELYLEQGHIEPALDIYRQLAAHEPEDPGIRARIEELSVGEPAERITGAETRAAQVGEPEGEAKSAPEGGQKEEQDAGQSGNLSHPDALAGAANGADLMQEAAGAGEISENGHDEIGDEAGTGTASERHFPESEQSTELWDTADSWGGGLFTDTEEADEIFGMSDDALSVGAGLSDERTSDAAIEPEPAATEADVVTPVTDAAVDVPPREMTVREFFATLGSMRPPLKEPGGGTEPIADVASVTGESSDVETPPTDEPYPIADDAFANLFGDAPISPEDNRAAAALSGAMAHGAPFSTPLTPAGPPPPPSPPPPRRDAAVPRASDQPTQESEEDIRRFREWLDGLAES